MRKVLASIFALAMVVACIAPAMAINQYGELENTAPSVVSVTPTYPAGGFVAGAVNPVTIDVLVRDVNGFDDLSSCTLAVYYESKTWIVCAALDDTNPAAVIGYAATTGIPDDEDSLYGMFEFTVNVPSSWNSGNYIVTAIPYDYAGTGQAGDGQFAVPTISGLTCEEITYVNLVAGGTQNDADVQVTNTGNEEGALTFTFDSLYYEGDTSSSYVIDGNSITCTLEGATIGCQGTPFVGAGGVITFPNAGDNPLGGTAGISAIPYGIISGTYIGTFEVEFQ